MILRFKSASTEPEYIGINTRLGTFTYNPEAVKAGTVMTLFCNDFDHVRSELAFCGYSYMNDLATAPMLEEVPF